MAALSSSPVPGRSLRASVRSSIAIAILTLVAAATIPAPAVPINVRWTPETTEAARRAIEQSFHLTAGALREDTTWRYILEDTSFRNVHGLIRHPAVDDTANLNRRFFRPPFAADRTAHVLLSGGVLTLATLLLGLGRGRPREVRVLRLSSSLLAGTLGVAPIVVVLALALTTVLAAVGVPTIWRSADVTPAQAALVADVASVARAIEGGADPNARTAVRLHAGAEPVMLTPLEAAVLSKEPEVVSLVVKLGATIGDTTRASLVCLAREVRADAVLDVLSPLANWSGDCAVVPLPPH
jgi:hypothetical protein